MRIDRGLVIYYIAALLTLQTAVCIYFVFNWRMVLERLAAIILDRWLSGTEIADTLY